MGTLTHLREEGVWYLRVFLCLVALHCINIINQEPETILAECEIQYNTVDI